MTERRDAATRDDLYAPDATWSDRKAFNEHRKASRESISLALDRLSVAGGTDDPNEALEALGDADAHLAAARDEIEQAFRGIDS